MSQHHIKSLVKSGKDKACIRLATNRPKHRKDYLICMRWDMQNSFFTVIEEVVDCLASISSGSL